MKQNKTESNNKCTLWSGGVAFDQENEWMVSRIFTWGGEQQYINKNRHSLTAREEYTRGYETKTYEELRLLYMWNVEPLHKEGKDEETYV